MMARKIRVILAVMLIPGLASATKFLNTKSPGYETDTVYNDDVFVSGEKIKFDSKVRGDLFTFSWEVVQTDSVEGNFMAVGNSIQNLGSVAGSFRAMGGSISCNSDVGRNLMMFSPAFTQVIKSLLTVGPQARIGMDAHLSGRTVIFQGEAARDLVIHARTAVISGIIGGNLDFNGDSLTINQGASIKGNLDYDSPFKATIADGASIAGDVNWRKTEYDKSAEKKGGFGRTFSWFISPRGYLLLSMLSSLVVFIFALLPFPALISIPFLWITLAVSGNILILLTRGKAIETEQVLFKRLFPSLGLGFVVLFLTPIVALVLFVSIVATPLALLSVMVFGIASFAGAIYACLFTGRRICGLFSSGSMKTPGYLCFTIGMVLLVALSFIPIVGYILMLVVMMGGLGALTLTFFGREKKEIPST